MSEEEIICPRCKAFSPPGSAYCQECGEVIGQKTRAELQRLAIILRDLDTRIADDKGSQTVASLRQEYYDRYQNLRRAPWLRPAPAVRVSLPSSARLPVGPAPFPPLQHAPAGVNAARPAPAAASEVITPAPAAARASSVASLVEQLAAASASASPTAAAPPPTRPVPVPPMPAGPVFSWRAFAADQAIAIMAYLGGFLALVATLTLVVSKGTNLPTLTLGIVSLVYVSFGAAGFSLRKIERLRTVSRVYLAVFALMTPLVALAIYRYQLQQLNFPVAGMLCISAVYATIVYLGLAVQTRFATYAYLGWTALIVAALAIIPWTNGDLQWWVFDLGATTLALLAPHQRRRHRRLGILAEPATQIAALATVPTVIGVQALGIIGLTQTVVYGAFPTIQVQPWPLALGACVLVPITAVWRFTVPSWRPNQRDALVDTIDGFNAVFFAEAVGGTTLAIAQLPLDLAVRPLAVSLGATALAEFGLALALYRWQPRRRGLRVFLEIFAVALAAGGAAIVLGNPAPNAPMLSALSAALIVSVGAAIIDGAWWLLVSGLFLTLDYDQLAQAIVPADQVIAHRLEFFFVLTLALWLAALLVGLSARLRRFVAPLYVVALGNALFTLAFLPQHDAGMQTEILLTFTAAAFSAGLREREPIAGGVVTVFFGALAAAPLALNDANGLHISLLALGLALAALAARRLWGQVWALAPYAIALWAVIVAAIQTSVGGLRVPDWGASGFLFTVWFLLFFAVLAYAVARWEQEPRITVIPAALALWALQLAITTSDGLHISLLALGLALAALAARRFWGRDWALAPYALTLWAVIVVALQTSVFGLRVPDWSASGLPFTAWFLLFFAALVYGVALWENQPLATIVPAALALWALRLTSSDLASVALVFALIAAGAGARAIIGRWWGAALQIAAAAGAVSVTVQLTNLGPAAPNWQVAFLLALAVAAYLVAAQERQPILSALALVYALVAVALLPGPDNLLPTLVLIFALAAFGVALRLLREQIRGAWVCAPYAAAVGASIFAAERVVPFNAGEVEALLLLFATLSYALVVLEGQPLAALLPLFYAIASIFIQPDPHALLSLALGFAVLGLIVGSVAGIRWAWTFYAAASVAAAATAVLGQNDAAFEAVALLSFAALAYLIAAIESRPDLLLVALVLGLLALGAGAHALHLPAWQAVLAFLALGWLYRLGAALWSAIPWLRPTRGAWWLETLEQPQRDHWRDPRASGALVHQVGGLLVVTGAALVSITAPDSFSIHDPQTLAVTAALLALAGMLALAAQHPEFHLAYYLAGELVALALTWTARWLGADNVQAFVLAPGSYQLLVGAFLPADRRVPYARRIGQFASITASFLLLLPTLYQTYNEPGVTAELIYGSVVLIESLIIVGLGVGTHTRLLVLVGSAFIGIDTLSGVALALKNGVSIALVVGLLALLLIGLATWLSLRTRRESTPT